MLAVVHAVVREKEKEPPHAHSPGVASGTVARRLRIDVHDNDNDNAWQRGPLWPHGMGPIKQSGILIETLPRGTKKHPSTNRE